MYYVLPSENKFDSIGNIVPDGLYRRWYYKIEPEDSKNFLPIYILHEEHFNTETNNWEKYGRYPAIEVLPDEQAKIQVQEAECSDAKSYLWYKPLAGKEMLEFTPRGQYIDSFSDLD